VNYVNSVFRYGVVARAPSVMLTALGPNDVVKGLAKASSRAGMMGGKGR